MLPPDPENCLIPYGTDFFSLQVSEDLKTRMMKMEAELIRVSLSNLYPVFRFVPHGSGSMSTRYGSGSGSFYHPAKIVSKTLIPTVL